MAVLTDPVIHRQYLTALSYWNFTGYIDWKEPAWRFVANELGIQPKLVGKLIYEHVRDGGAIHQIPETREQWLEWRFHYDLYVKVGEREVYLETVLLDDDPEDCVIRVVEVPMTHEAKEQSKRPRYPMRCTACGKKASVPATIPYMAEVKHDGRHYTVQVPDLNVVKCTECGDILLGNDANDQIAAALRAQLGFLPPEEIRENRERLGLTQRALSEQLGAAEETISRWESGLQIQSRAMDNFLRIYFDVPEVRRRLTQYSAALAH